MIFQGDIIRFQSSKLIVIGYVGVDEDDQWCDSLVMGDLLFLEKRKQFMLDNRIIFLPAAFRQLMVPLFLTGEKFRLRLVKLLENVCFGNGAG
jgi:hypothetical protein